MFAFITFPNASKRTKERMWANWFPTVYRKILYRPFFCIADNCMEWQWVDRSQQHSISRQLPIHCSCLLIKLTRVIEPKEAPGVELTTLEDAARFMGKMRPFRQRWPHWA